ncbi:MAG: hypothetical protein Fur0022_33750 [Anaerolineales bacterium]
MEHSQDSSPISNIQSPVPAHRSPLTRLLGWNRASYTLMSGFALTLFLLGYVWWPLAEEYLSYIPWDGEWWRYMDWLLIGIFLFMSLMIMAHANLKQDAKIVLVGLIGGLVIESWGTQTEIWTYYTAERPPLWIIPAWPIASLTIDRMVRFLTGEGRRKTGDGRQKTELVPRPLSPVWYWLTFLLYFALFISYVAPTFAKSFTWIATGLVIFFILTPTDYRVATLTFLAGSGLGYFLELWGTTRECWTYYTLETPPLFAVLSHGMAAVAFWRGGRGLEWGLGKTQKIMQRLGIGKITREISPSDSAG